MNKFDILKIIHCVEQERTKARMYAYKTNIKVENRRKWLAKIKDADIIIDSLWETYHKLSVDNKQTDVV